MAIFKRLTDQMEGMTMGMSQMFSAWDRPCSPTNLEKAQLAICFLMNLTLHGSASKAPHSAMKAHHSHRGVLRTRQVWDSGLWGKCYLVPSHRALFCPFILLDPRIISAGNEQARGRSGLLEGPIKLWTYENRKCRGWARPVLVLAPGFIRKIEQSRGPG